MHGTPGWTQLDENKQHHVEAPLAARTNPDGVDGISIPMLREQYDACSAVLAKAVEEMLRILDGARIVRVAASGYFSGGIESEEQLERALTGLRDECMELIATGKKVLIQ